MRYFDNFLFLQHIIPLEKNNDNYHFFWDKGWKDIIGKQRVSLNEILKWDMPCFSKLQNDLIFYLKLFIVEKQLIGLTF